MAAPHVAGLYANIMAGFRKFNIPFTIQGASDWIRGSGGSFPVDWQFGGVNATYEAICTALGHSSWQEVVRAAVFHTFKHAKEKRAVELAIQHSKYGEHIAVRVAAIGALGAIGKELHKEHAADKIVDHLLALLLDNAIRARLAAIRALGKIGHERALPALQAAQTRECLDQLKAALQDAIEGIQKK